MNLDRTTALGFSLAFAILVAIGVLSHRSELALYRATNERARARQSSMELRVLQLRLIEAESAQRGFLLTGDEAYLEPYDQAVAHLIAQARILAESYSDDPAQADPLAEVEALSSEVLDLLNQTIALRQKKGLAAAIREMQAGNVSARIERFRAVIRRMVDRETDRLAAREEGAVRTLHSSSIILGLGSILALTLVAVAGFFFQRDQARRRKAEEALKQSESFLHTIFENIPNMVFVKDAKDLRFVRFNRAGEELLGHPRSDLIGKNDYDFFPPAEAEQFTNKDREILRGAAHVAVIVEPIHTRTHGVRTLRTKKLPVYDERGTPAYLLGISEDITEAKRSEEALMSLNADLERRVEERTAQLELERARFETVLQQLPSAVMIAEAPSGRLIFANNKVIGMESPPQSIDEYTMWKGFRPDGRPYQPTDWPLARSILRGEVVTNEDIELERPDGGRGVMRSTSTPIRNPRGEIVAGVVIYHDVTTLIRNTQEREQMRVREQAALEASRMKSSFLANMSHEVRTPLNGITGMAGLLLGTELQPEQRDYVETLQRCASSLLVVVNDILDFSKVESGKLELESIDCELASLVQDVQKTMMHAATRKGLRLLSDVGTDLYVPVKGDPARLRQVLINLLNNAIKFTDQGEVELKVSRQAETEASLTFRFEVRDTGIGISPAAQERLFRPFTQADSSTTRKYGGTGLGLSICKRLIDLMGGTIGIESKEGYGSIFWFEITLARGTAVSAGAESETVMPANGRKRARILIAEDNPVNRKLALKLMERLGYQAEAVENGELVQEKLTSEQFDLVLMDCQMPVRDGYETSREIRAKETPGHHIPIIAMTANAILGDRERCLAAGMDDYVAKPIDERQLQHCIAFWLERRAPLERRLAELERDYGQSTVEELVTLFVRNGEDLIGKMRGEMVRADLIELARHAHTLKSGCANLGVEKMAELCAELETVANGQSAEAASVLLAEAEQEFMRAREALLARRSRGKRAA